MFGYGVLRGIIRPQRLTPFGAALEGVQICYANLVEPGR